MEQKSNAVKALTGGIAHLFKQNKVSTFYVQIFPLFYIHDKNCFMLTVMLWLPLLGSEVHQKENIESNDP